MRQPEGEGLPLQLQSWVPSGEFLCWVLCTASDASERRKNTRALTPGGYDGGAGGLEILPAPSLGDSGPSGGYGGGSTCGDEAVACSAPYGI